MGVGWGLALAAAYSAYVMVLYGIRGAEPFERIGVTLPSVVGTYVFGGVLGGVIVGQLRPLTRWRAGATLVGIVACVPLSFATMIAIAGAPSHWDFGGVVGATISVVLIGGIAGFRSWEPPTR